MKKLCILLLFSLKFYLSVSAQILINLKNILEPSVVTISISPSSASFISEAPANPTAQIITYTFHNTTAGSDAISLPTFIEGSIDGGSTWHAGFSGLSDCSSCSLEIRTTSSTTPNSYGPTNAVFSSTTVGAISQNCALSALVTALSASPSSISSLNGTTGTPGTAQIVTITFSGSSITATAPTNTEISKDGGSTYNSPQTLTSGSPLGLKIRTKASSPVTTISGNLVLTGSNVTTVNVPISGTVSAAPSGDSAKFMFSLTAKTPPTGFVNVFGDPATGIRTGSNGSGTISVSSIGVGNWAPYTGPTSAYDIYGMTGSTISIFPDNDLNQAWFQYSSTGGHQADSATQTFSTPQLQISGSSISNANTYTIYAVGSINFSSAAFASQNRYWLKGASTYLGVPSAYTGSLCCNVFDAQNNTSRYITWTNVVPDGSNHILLYLWTIPGQEACELSSLIIIKN